MAEIEFVDTGELRQMNEAEGLVIQGCGGDLAEWVEGINEMLTKEDILLDGTKFEKVFVFKNNGLTNLLFRFSDDVKIHIGKLALWRIATHAAYGGTWLSDYVENRLGGFESSDTISDDAEDDAFEDDIMLS